MGKSTISMAIFNSYVSLPEGIPLIIPLTVSLPEVFQPLTLILHYYPLLTMNMYS